MRLQNPSSAFWSMYFPCVSLLYSLSLLQPTTTVLSAVGNETDKLALLKFKESISNDPHGVLSSWNNSLHFCDWRGVSCGGKHQRITTLDLSDHNLGGTISPYVGNFTFLSILNLGSNFFFGEIPRQVGHLFRMRHLNLSHNLLGGNVPVNLSHCLELRELTLGNNKLVGEIPLEFGSLVKLETLHLGSNNLTGGVPSFVGNISSLTSFIVQYNNLAGNLPSELGRLKNLTYLSVGPNNLSGIIPPSLYNISSIKTFGVEFNKFYGTLPPNIGLTVLPNVEEFLACSNEFSGKIPESISNASRLQIIDICENNFVGQVPKSLGNLPDLWWLNLRNNRLGSYSANSFDFIASLSNCSQLKTLGVSMNNFGGVLPNSLANLSAKLTELHLGDNRISGYIPETLQNQANLMVLSMESNLFTGAIPASLGMLRNLQILNFESSLLSGKIPTSIGNLTKIFKLNLSHNKLQGSIPPSIGNFQQLQFIDMSGNNLSGPIPRELFGLYSPIKLNFSGNSLTGELPVEVGRLKHMNALDLSDNKMTGEIPDTIGHCESVESLYLQGNFFKGELPSEMASLKGLQHLDVSRNNLTGQIPNGFEKLLFLMYLNISFNDMEGQVPNSGVFQNTSAVSVVGNAKLCGGVAKLQLPECPDKESKKGKTNGFKLTIVIVGLAAVFLLFLVLVILYFKRKSQRKSQRKLSTSVSTIRFLPKVSYKKLYQATDGFSQSMLIGTGSFGSVYKGILDQKEKLVAIKVLNLQQKGAEKSFLAECNALRNVRHRNLVRISTCCSSMDYHGNDFKALVYDYMPNGSLEKWLHHVNDGENRSGGLNMIQRLNIAIDVASAIHYLHDECDDPIIHRDLKPSNVLLDNELVAHVSDFGLARLVSSTTGIFDSHTGTTGIKGTIGYAPPEYAMGGEPSTKGDVYSYGILVLEMFTGKRPTDEMFKDDFNLRNFVKMALPESLVKVVESALLQREVEVNALRKEHGRNRGNDGGIEIPIEDGKINFEHPNQISSDIRKCLVSVLEIGVACSADSPSERMNMGDVTRELQHIRNAYTSVLR